jgi:uncharacterized protein (DUF169 family)
MYWQKWSDRLKQDLTLGANPVAVIFAGAPAPGTIAPQGKVSVCQALKRASEGEDVTITAETCGCPGGLVSLGLGQMPPQFHRMIGILHALDQGVGGRGEEKPESVERHIDELGRVAPV